MIQGTASQLVARNTRINNVVVKATDFGPLARLGIIQDIGAEKRQPGSRGRAGRIYSIDPSKIAAE